MPTSSRVLFLLRRTITSRCSSSGLRNSQQERLLPQCRRQEEARIHRQFASQVSFSTSSSREFIERPSLVSNEGIQCSKIDQGLAPRLLATTSSSSSSWRTWLSCSSSWHVLHATPCPRTPSYFHYDRSFHSSCRSLDDSNDDSEKPMSPKEKKKALKAKAKAAAQAAAAAAKEQEEAKAKQSSETTTATDAADDGDKEARKAALKEKMMAKKKAKKQDAPPAPPPSTGEEPLQQPTATSEPEQKPSSEGHSDEVDEEINDDDDGPRVYSTPELTEDAARHKAGLKDPDVPSWQNPLHHNNPDMEKQFREDFDSQEEFERAILPAPPFETDDGKCAAPEYLHALADEIVHLTMLEMNELVNKIADHYGLREGMLSPPLGDDGDGGGAEDGDGDGAGDAGAAASAPAAEQTAFDIKLAAYDPKSKIKVIKEVRALCGLGLKESKELVEGAPTTIQKGVSKGDAEETKAKLEGVGATIEIV